MARAAITARAHSCAKQQRANEALASRFPALQTYFQACRRGVFSVLRPETTWVRLEDKE